MESDVENKTSSGDGRDDVTSGTEDAGSASPSSNHGGSIRSVILDPFFVVKLVFEHRSRPNKLWYLPHVQEFVEA